MNANRNDKAWAARLEAGHEDDPLLELAAQLKRAGEETQAAPTVAFQRQLRRDLLNQYERPAARPWARLERWAASALAVIVLAAAVGLTWFSISGNGRPSFGGTALTELATTEQPGAATGIEADTVIVPPPPDGVAYMESQGYSAPNGLIPGGTLEFTGRWRIPASIVNGTAVMTFLHLRDEAGALFAQADGPLTIAAATATADPDNAPGRGLPIVPRHARRPALGRVPARRRAVRR